MNRIKTAAAAIFATVAMGAPAMGQDFNFDYAPWMLTSPEGRTEVLNRLERRVSNYCNVSQARGALQRMIAQDCQERIFEQAISQIDDPRVLALHQQRELERRA